MSEVASSRCVELQLRKPPMRIQFVFLHLVKTAGVNYMAMLSNNKLTYFNSARCKF